MSFYEDASWLLIPSGIEEDVVFAQKPISGLGDLTYTRASDATYTDSTGVVRRSPYNLLQQSEMFSNAVWVKPNLTIGIDSTVAPNGTLTADKIIPSTLLSFHPLGQVRTVISGTIYSFSIYAKAGEYNFLLINTVSGSSSGNVGPLFNLSNGTLIGSLGGNTYNAQIVSVGNGWYRISFSFTTNATSATIDINTFPTSTIATYSGNGTDGVFLWGAQLVEGTEALDYFPTTNRQDVPRIDFRNADGTLSSCGRLLLEPQRTNSIRNSSMVGAVAGTPGTFPTNWPPPSGIGLTQTVVGIGNENGVPYIDLRFNGTAIGTSNQISFEATNFIAATTGQTWAGSFWFKIISAPNPPTSYNIRFREATAAGTFVADGLQAFTPNTTLQRFNYVRTNTGGVTTERIQPMILIGQVNGATYDYTIRIAAPQMELGAYATTWVPTTTAAVTRLVDSYTRNNIYTNGLISAAGGTWIVDLSNNLSLIRSDNNGVFIGDSTTINTGNQLVIRNGSASVSFRFTIFKYISGVGTSLFVTSTNNAKIAIKWNGTTADVFVNGIKEVSATSFTPTLMQNLIGSGAAVPYYINQSFLAPTPLSDAECIERTTL